jgi:hypothetical protein
MQAGSRAAVCLYHSQLGGAVCLHMWQDCHCIPSWGPLGSKCTSIQLRHCPWWTFVVLRHPPVGMAACPVGESAARVAHAFTSTYLQRCRPYYMPATTAAALLMRELLVVLLDMLACVMSIHTACSLVPKAHAAGAAKVTCPSMPRLPPEAVCSCCRPD